MSVIYQKNAQLFFFAAVISALCISGCSRSADSSYYTLTTESPTIKGSIERDTEHKAVLRLGPLHIPKYLDRPQIVTRTGTNQFNINDYARWAEPLGASVTRNLVINIAQQLPDFFVYEFGQKTALADITTFTMPMEIRQFDVDTNGNAVLEIQWGIEDHVNNKILIARSTVVRTKSSGAGYPAQAQALSDLLKLFSIEVAAEIGDFPVPEKATGIGTDVATED